MVALSWSADAAGLIGETAALTGRPFGGNLVLQWDQPAPGPSARGRAADRLAHLGDPGPYVGRAHDASALVLHTVAVRRKRGGRWRAGSM
jgi:nitronate monooxygenase